MFLRKWQKRDLMLIISCKISKCTINVPVAWSYILKMSLLAFMNVGMWYVTIPVLIDAIAPSVTLLTIKSGQVLSTLFLSTSRHCRLPNTIITTFALSRKMGLAEEWSLRISVVIQQLLIYWSNPKISYIFTKQQQTDIYV